MKLNLVSLLFVTLVVLALLASCVPVAQPTTTPVATTAASATPVAALTTAAGAATATLAPSASVTETTIAQPAAATTPAASGVYSLEFPADVFTTETVTVTTSSGVVEVTYHLYSAIPYVANPVDVNYESMNVKVPLTIDGKNVDATNAPILFANSVGGYMSSSISNVGGGARDMNGAAIGGTGQFTGTMTGALPSGVMTGTLPGGAPPGGMMGGPGGNDSGVSSNTDLALAAGYVVVQPGARGRDNQADNGTYYGKAPAAIVDLKAAVRYLHYNDATMPGNANWIISTGVSAGGALSALLGASGDSDLYEPYLKELGAADASDAIFASADYCPITDLDHADIAYEWQLSGLPYNGQQVDQTVSQQLALAFADYEASLKLQGLNNFGAITADNLGEYLVQNYLEPSATKYLLALADDARTTYLTNNPWIKWENNTAAFTWADFLTHLGSRKKSVPAFDAFDLSAGENSLFGNATTSARHFTDFSAAQDTSGQSTAVDADVPALVALMNPMPFIAGGCTGCAAHWWIRLGTSDVDTSLAISANLATALQNQGQDVNYSLYWDAGHGADEDPEAFIAWIAQITGYPAQ